jgi:hypothetical protein
VPRRRAAGSTASSPSERRRSAVADEPRASRDRVETSPRPARVSDRFTADAARGAPRIAVGTSLVVIAMKSFAGLAGHLGHTGVDRPITLAALVLAGPLGLI